MVGVMGCSDMLSGGSGVECECGYGMGVWGVFMECGNGIEWYGDMGLLYRICSTLST